MIELKDQKEQDNKDSLEEAETIVKMKNSGYDRNSPQYQSIPKSLKNSPHSNQKRTEEEFNCYECDFQSNEQYLLEKHISWKHEAAKCGVCEYIGGNKVVLEKHMQFKHSKAKNLSKTNPTIGIDLQESNSKKHIETKNQNNERKLFECYDCDYESEDKEQLKQHLQNKHGIEIVKKNIELEGNTLL